MPTDDTDKSAETQPETVADVVAGLDAIIDEGCESEAEFRLEMMRAELDVLWRVVFGDQPMPEIERRALVSLWGAAMTVDWSHLKRSEPELPVGLVLVKDGEASS